MYKIITFVAFSAIILCISFPVNSQIRSYTDIYRDSNRINFDLNDCIEQIASVYTDKQKERICRAREKRHSVINGKCPVEKHNRGKSFCLIGDSANTVSNNQRRVKSMIMTFDQRVALLRGRQAGSNIILRTRSASSSFLSIYYRENHNGPWPVNPECSIGYYNQCVSDNGTIYRITATGVDVIRPGRWNGCTSQRRCIPRFAGTNTSYMSYPWALKHGE